MNNINLVKDLKDIYGENLLSVVLYGKNTEDEEPKKDLKQNIIVIYFNFQL